MSLFGSLFKKPSVGPSFEEFSSQYDAYVAANKQAKYGQEAKDFRDLQDYVDNYRNANATLSNSQQAKFRNQTMSNTQADKEVTGLRASSVIAFLANRGLSKAWVEKMTEIVKVGSGGGADAVIDNMDTLKEILMMSVPLLKRQLKAVEVVHEFCSAATIDFEKTLDENAHKPFYNILEETEVDQFTPAPRALDDQHLKSLEFKKLLQEMGERALFNGEKIRLVETLNADGSFSWAIAQL